MRDDPMREGLAFARIVEGMDLTQVKTAAWPAASNRPKNWRVHRLRSEGALVPCL